MIELKDICEIITCGVAKRPEYVKSGVPFLSSKNVKTNRFILKHYNYVSEEDFLKLTKYNKPEKGDILYTRVGSFGEAVVIDLDFDFAIFVSLTLLKPKKNKVVSRYLMHYLNSPKIKNLAKNSTSGIGVQNLNVNTVRRFPIELPPLAEQKRIANILDHADQLRQLNQQILAEYDVLTKSLFLDMFGDPVANPMGWEMKRLKEVSTQISSGTTPKGGSSVYVEKGITFFRSQNVWKNRLVYNNVAYIDQTTHDKMTKSSLKNGDILMTKTGRVNTENSSLGRAAMFVGEDDSANVNGHVYLIRLQKDIINEFVLFILTTKRYRDYIRSVCVGGIDKRQLNKNHLEEFPIILPPIALQNQFAQKIKNIEAQKAKAQAALAASEDLFNHLLQKAFKGEL